MRKIYERSERVELVAAVKGGETVPIAAGRLGVKLSTAYKWVKKSREVAIERAPRFVELVAPSSNAPLVVRVGGAEMEVRAGFDSTVLAAVVAVLRGAA